MTDDILTQLRNILAEPGDFSGKVLEDAADEIERLREKNRELEMHIGKLVFEKYDL